MSLNTEFHSLTVAEVRRETPDAVSVRFDIPPALREMFTFKAGQHLTLRTALGGRDVRRNYSICMAPDENEIRVAIKQMPQGLFSNWANSALAPGNSIDVLPPMGRFVVPESGGAEPYYVAIAGGSGITPIMSILKTVLKERPRSRFVLLYGNRDSSSIMFLEELASLKNRYLDRLEIYHFLENEIDEIEIFNGRLDRARCEDAFKRLVDVKAADAFFICGPGPMMDAVEAALSAQEIGPERVFIERFSTSDFSAEQRARMEDLERHASGAKLSVTLDGRQIVIPFDAARGNILESVHAAGLSAPYACKGGVCTTCRARVVSGEVAMKNNYGLTDREIEQGYVLTCQAVPTSTTVVLSYDE